MPNLDGWQLTNTETLIKAGNIGKHPVGGPAERVKAISGFADHQVDAADDRIGCSNHDSCKGGWQLFPDGGDDLIGDLHLIDDEITGGFGGSHHTGPGRFKPRSKRIDEGCNKRIKPIPNELPDGKQCIAHGD